jgi:hypothetical protein
MNWKDYEKEILDCFREQFPKAEISFDVKVIGRFSKVARQIDILIEDYVAGNRMRIIVDGKYFSKNIDVKNVEMFIGMLTDCEAHKGLLITQKGFSKAAINRAHYDTIDIELDILNFKDLHEFQGLYAIPYSGNHGVDLPAPFGWIIDARKSPDMLATLYQRGLTLYEATKNKEWMYVKIVSKNDIIKNLDDLLKFQYEEIIKDYPNAKFDFIPTIRRTDANVKIRTIEIDTYPTIEYTGFVDFTDFVFFCVMFTPEEQKKKNIRKLEGIMQQVTPFKIIQKDKQN